MSYLVIILPPPPKACDRNHGKHGIAAAGENKRARLIAKARTLETLRARGMDACDFRPCNITLWMLDNSGRRDWDNAVSSFKHYQDGIFDALGCDDRNIRAAHFAFCKHPGISPRNAANGWFAVMLSNNGLGSIAYRNEMEAMKEEARTEMELALKDAAKEGRV